MWSDMNVIFVFVCRFFNGPWNWLVSWLTQLANFEDVRKLEIIRHNLIYRVWPCKLTFLKRNWSSRPSELYESQLVRMMLECFSHILFDFSTMIHWLLCSNILVSMKLPIISFYVLHKDLQSNRVVMLNCQTICYLYFYSCQNYSNSPNITIIYVPWPPSLHSYWSIP